MKGEGEKKERKNPALLMQGDKQHRGTKIVGSAKRRVEMHNPEVR